MFPEGFVDEVKRAGDIVRYLSEHMTLRKVGGSYKGLCPFHREKTPSFTVRSEPPIFKCFGCGQSGDVFKFAMLHEHLSFPEAVEAVARRFGIALPERRRQPEEASAERKERDEIFALMEAAALHFTQTLWSAGGTSAREYLLGRGFKQATLEALRAGAARDSWNDLLEALRRRFSPELMLKAGLVLQKEEGGRVYDRFRARAVFPILSETGKVVAFGARSLDGSEPKYLNSPETPVYQKGRTLYGLSAAKEAIRREGRAVLMEGYLDVARAVECGVEEAVASCGTALTSAQARLLRRFTGKVIVSFDQDEAGQNAARKSYEALADEGLQVHVVRLPPGHDPDTFLKEAGAEAYRERLAAAPPFLDWLIEAAATENRIDTPAGKAAFMSTVAPALARVSNAVERAAWLNRAAARAGLDERAAAVELRRALPRAQGEAAPAAPVVKPAVPARLLPVERHLIAHIAFESEGVGDALRQLEEDQFTGLGSAPVLRAAHALASAGIRPTFDAVEAALAEDEEARALLTNAAIAEAQGETASPPECVRELARLPLKARMAAIKHELARAQGPMLDSLLQEQQSLGRRMADL